MTPTRLTRVGKPWRLLGGAVCLSMMGLGIAAVGLRDDGHRRDDPSAVVVRGNLEDAVLATGTLNATGMVAIGTQVNGQVRALLVKVGDRVRPGQLLAEIDPALARSALDKARAVRDAAQAQLALRAMALQRLQKVLDRQLALRSRQANAQADVESAGGDVDAARSEQTVAQAQLRQAQLDVDAAQAGLDFTSIRAPAAGEILHVAAQAGQTLVSNQASPTLMVMGSLDVMTLKARIGEADVIRVRAGQQALFTIPGVPGRKFSGIVRAVESLPAQSVADSRGPGTAATGPVYYDALLDVANPDRLLRPAMSAQVRIVQASVKQVLIAPRSALIDWSGDDSQAVAMVRHPGRPPEPRRVRIGVDDGLRVEIRDGLNEGDRLELSGPATGEDHAARAAEQERRR